MKRPNDTSATIDALQAILGDVEATWITSQGVKVFKVDLSGIVDNEKRMSRYLKVRK